MHQDVDSVGRPKPIDICEAIKRCQERRTRVLAGSVSWGGWTYEPSIFVLNHRCGYQVNLLQLDSARDTVSWIHHLAAKTTRFDANSLGHFVRALHEIGGSTGDGYDDRKMWRVLAERELRYPLPTPMRPEQYQGKRGVYAIRAGATVKIGKATDIGARRDGLQTGNAERLEVLAILSEKPDDERFWHQRFSHLRIEGGEWFHLGEQIAVWLRDARWDPVAELMGYGQD